jgi:hypothetical protein
MFETKKIRTVTRSEMYERAWTTPMTTLAKEFGISDVGLRKLCKRAGIPLPPGGYWMKKQHGKRPPRKPPLPPLQSGENEELRIAETPKKVEIEIDVPPEIARAIEFERAQTEPIPFPNSPKPHAIVKSWERARQPSYGPPSFTPAAESRRRRIASVLLREIEKRGAKVTSESQHAFSIVLFRQTIKITITERMVKERVPLAEKERGWYSRDYRTELRPSGLLRLRFENYFRQPLRKEWNETADKPLEVRLREIIVGLYVAAAALQREAEAEAIRRQREAEEQQRRWEAAQQRKKKRERVEALLEDAASWSKAESLRKYIAAVEQTGAKTDSAEWLSFARRIADALDPLVESESVDGEEPKPYSWLH